MDEEESPATHPAPAAAGPKGRRAEPGYRLYRFRGWLFLPPGLFMALCFSWEVESDWLLWPLGCALFAAGLALRVWAQVHLRYRLDTHKVLTLTGPYAFVRNPIYIGNTLLMLGLCAMSELLWLAPVVLLWCVLVYRRVVRHEEAHLLLKYGPPYRDFLSRVPRWLPRRRAGAGTRLAGARRFLLPALLAEAHNLLYLIPVVVKELYGPR